MSIENITTKDGKETEGARSVTVAFDFGDNLEQAVEKFGAEAVFNSFKADARVGLQAKVRALLKATMEDSEELKYTDEEIVEKAAEYIPGSKTRASSDPLAKLQALLGKLTPEQKAALLEANL